VRQQREEREQRTADDQQDRRGDAVAPTDRRADQHGRAETTTSSNASMGPSSPAVSPRAELCEPADSGIAATDRGGRVRLPHLDRQGAVAVAIVVFSLGSWRRARMRN
jgi:hypothetical protein